VNIEKLMIRNVVTLQEDATVHEAVQLLNKYKIGCVIITSNGQIRGIITERDLLERVLEQCKNPKQTKVTEIMTRKVITGTPTMDTLEATRLMFKLKVKKLPITENNKLVGIVTLTDIARASSVDQKTIELIEQLSNMHIIA
jgi:CBS domain-containing protein